MTLNSPASYLKLISEIGTFAKKWWVSINLTFGDLVVTLILTLEKHLPKYFGNDLWRAFEHIFLFLATISRSLVWGGSQPPPPTSGGGKSRGPSGRVLTSCLGVNIQDRLPQALTRIQKSSRSRDSPNPKPIDYAGLWDPWRFIIPSSLWQFCLHMVHFWLQQIKCSRSI